MCFVVYSKIQLCDLRLILLSLVTYYITYPSRIFVLVFVCKSQKIININFLYLRARNVVLQSEYGI